MSNIIEVAKRLADATAKGIRTRAEKRRNEQEARKEGVPVAVIEYKNYVESNAKQAQEVANRFGEELARLGYCMDGRIITSPKGEQQVKVEIHSLSYEEHQEFVIFQERVRKAHEESARKAQEKGEETEIVKTETETINPEKSDGKTE